MSAGWCELKPRLTAEAQAYVDSFTVNKPEVEVIDGRLILTWHFQPCPWPSAKIDKVHRQEVTDRLIRQAQTAD
jgi:hypothetical protein